MGSTDDDVFIAVSTNGGQTFSKPGDINQIKAIADNPQIAIS